MSRKDPNIFLAHARDCAAKIIEYTREGADSFYSDQRTQDAVLRNLEIIGQCIKDADLAALETLNPAVPWCDIAAFRNILAHVYLGIEMSIVWDVIENQIMPLHTQLNQMLENWNP